MPSDARYEGPIEVRLRMPPAVDAPLRARAEVEGLGLPSPSGDDVKLLVSELVTNCVVHAGLAAGQEIDMHLAETGSALRVEVCDEGRGFADALRGRDSNGFGLYLVEQLADRWGVERGARTCVWFEVDVPGW